MVVYILQFSLCSLSISYDFMSIVLFVDSSLMNIASASMICSQVAFLCNFLRPTLLMMCLTLWMSVFVRFSSCFILSVNE